MTNLIIILTTWHYSTHLLIQVFLLYYTFDSRWTFSYSELGGWLPILLYLGFNHIQSLLLFSVFTAITPRPISFLCCGGRALGTFLCNSLGISFPAIRLVNFYAHHCTPGLFIVNPFQLCVKYDSLLHISYKRLMFSHKNRLYHYHNGL